MYILPNETTGKTYVLPIESDKDVLNVHFTGVRHLPKIGECLNTFSTGGRQLVSSIVEIEKGFFRVYSNFVGCKGISPTENHLLWYLYKN